MEEILFKVSSETTITASEMAKLITDTPESTKEIFILAIGDDRQFLEINRVLTNWQISQLIEGIDDENSLISALAFAEVFGLDKLLSDIFEYGYYWNNDVVVHHTTSPVEIGKEYAQDFLYLNLTRWDSWILDYIDFEKIGERVIKDREFYKTSYGYMQIL